MFSKEDAIQHWNTRAAPDLAALALSRGEALAKAEAENARLTALLNGRENG
jgi:hypothetical protein